MPPTLRATAPGRALESDNYEVFDHLIKSKGLDIEERNDEGQTALHCAAKLCSGMIVNRLVENGADVNVRDNYGKTPLHYVSRDKVSISPTFSTSSFFGTKVIHAVLTLFCIFGEWKLAKRWSLNVVGLTSGVNFTNVL